MQKTVKAIDRIGEKHGNLTIISILKLPGENTKCVARCDCGNEKALFVCNIVSKKATSCGCEKDKKTSDRFATHGKSKTRIYKIYKAMKYRCYNDKGEYYKLYGGRGIIICDEWLNDFQTFYNWSIANGYLENLSIDRKNVNGNYEPTNCRWATADEQAKNKRKSINNKSGVSGVCYHNVLHKWEAYINHNKKNKYLGIFNTKEEAVEARRQAELLYW
jgi:hypothetical protein